MAYMSMQSQAILSALLEDTASPKYGLEMAKAAGLASGTVYPILARLERQGLVESELEDVDPSVAGRRPRRYYSLTGEGARVANVEIKTTLKLLKPRVMPGAFPRPA